ncbi:MAG: hypothetical protein QNJ97_29060 [Myxococcota bacterium]|nr:hypothetical protein [Myxococcota bacterium]
MRSWGWCGQPFDNFIESLPRPIGGARLLLQESRLLIPFIHKSVRLLTIVKLIQIDSGCVLAVERLTIPESDTRLHAVDMKVELRSEERG